MLGRFTAYAGPVYAFAGDADGQVKVPPADARWAEVIGGVDWGYTTPTAAVVFGLDGDGRAWQLDEWYARRAALEGAVLPALAELTRRHGVGAWYCGPDEPEHSAALRAALARDGLACRVVAADHALRPGIQTVTGLLARRSDGTRGLRVAPSCRHTIAKYGCYQYPPGDAGLRGGALLPLPERGLGAERSELPVKANDHAMDATRYALHTHLSCSAAPPRKHSRAWRGGRRCARGEQRGRDIAAVKPPEQGTGALPAVNLPGQGDGD